MFIAALFTVSRRVFSIYKTAQRIRLRILSTTHKEELKVPDFV